MRVAVLGAGHNALVAAILLARRGATVEVLEARDTVGGLCAGGGFHDGFRHVGILHDSATVRPWVIEACQLADFGLTLRTPAPIVVVDPETGEGATLDGLGGFAERVQPALRALLDAPAPDLGPGASVLPVLRRALAVRSLGAAAMTELLRVAALPADVWLSEHGLDPVRRAGLALGGLLGAWMGPLSPHGAGILLLTDALRGPEVVGGPARLVEVLAEAARARGVTIRTGAPADGIEITGGRATGVRVAGETVAADVVVSGLDPRRTLLELVPPQALEPEVEDAARAHRMRGIVAKAHVALAGLPALRGAAAPEHVRVVSGPLALERAFDAAKHRRLPEAPALDVRLPSMSDPDLAPYDHHVASVLAFGVPHDLDGGWTDAARTCLRDAILGQLEAAWPGLGARVLATEVLTPADLAAGGGPTGGHLHHGELALDQLWSFRPSPSMARHATPIPGLYLASGGTHPMGGVTGAPGAFAAWAVLARERA